MIILYIDPGTGSMLFSVLIGLAAAGIYALRGLFIKLKFVVSGGRIEENEKSGHSYVVFAESKRYWNVFGPICDELERREIVTEYWTTSQDDPAFQRNYHSVHPVFIGEGNRAFARLNLMHADIVLSTTPGLDVLQWKRSKFVKYYAHILHAVGSAAGYRMFGIDYYDGMLLSGKYQGDEVRKLEELRNLPPKDIEYVGQPYLDSLWERKQITNAELTALQKNKDNCTVLLAPSWGASSILCRYGERFIDSLIQTGYDIIIRPHPQSFTADKDVVTRLMTKYPDSDKLHWNRDNDNFDVLNQTDIMITDFSGVIYDFVLIFDKPIIYADTSFDHAPYDSAWLTEEMWKFRILPKLGCKLEESEFDRMKDVIDDVITNDSYAKGRRQAREEAWMYPGEAAKRTVDFLVEKRAQLKEVK